MPVRSPITADDSVLVLASYMALRRHGLAMTQDFYTLLFERLPEVRALFPAEMERQHRKVTATLALVIENIHDTEGLAPRLRELGRLHAGFGTLITHYPQFSEVLLATLARHRGPAWSAREHLAWSRLLDYVTDEMIKGAQEADT